MLKKFFAPYKTVFENFRYVRKFWINQIMSSILGILITWPILVFVEKHESMKIWAPLLASAFTIGFFCFLIYDNMFELGAKDYLRVNHQNAESDRFKGFKIISFAYLPTILCVVLALIFYICKLNPAYGIMSLILNFGIHSMYAGIYSVLPSAFQVLVLPLSLLVVPAFGCLGYGLAVRDKSIRGLLGIKPTYKKD